MVIGSFAPLFILWAVKGNKLIPNTIFVLSCLFCTIIPNLILLWRIIIAKRHHDIFSLSIKYVKDDRDHILTYLFPMLLPFYPTVTECVRDFMTIFIAICFVIFIFWHLNLYYINIFFAILGYHIFTIYPPFENPLCNKMPRILITRREYIHVENDSVLEIEAYRISNSVFLEG
jgi:hypothetical protein